MNRTEADEAGGVILKAVIELSVAFARQLSALPQAADDEKGENGKAKDAADNRNDDRLWRDYKRRKMDRQQLAKQSTSMRVCRVQANPLSASRRGETHPSDRQ